MVNTWQRDLILETLNHLIEATQNQEAGSHLRGEKKYPLHPESNPQKQRTWVVEI